MNLGIYYSPLAAISSPTGVGKHIVQMAGALAADPGVERVSLLAHRRAYAELDGQLPPALARLPISLVPGSEAMMRRIQLLTRRIPIDRWAGDVDWIYCPKEQPVATKRARLAVMVHDVLVLEGGIEGMRKPRGLAVRRWRLTMSRIFQRAHLIATASQFTAQRMLGLLDVRDHRRIVVIGNGVEPIFYRTRQDADVHVLRRYGVEANRYVLCVGSLTYRKGGDSVLALAARLTEGRDPIQILVSGRRHDVNLLAQYESDKARHPLLPMRLGGYIPDDDLAVLYSNALALLFPSRYEGFGIPVLEAMAAGAPVICSGAGALPEVAGDAAMQVEPHDVDTMLELMQLLDREPERRAQMTHTGRGRAQRYTWAQCASTLVRAMQSA
jgi:glycosyltransferase involved in cell wall biosynthesis